MESKRIEIIDFIKAFAILCVVVYHFPIDYMRCLPPLIRRGSYILGTGCHAFLVMSGFGLYFSFKRKPMSAPRFWLKRLSRIYFPYIAVVLVSYFCENVYLQSDVSRFSALMSHVFLYKMFFPQYEVTFGGHFWFISTIIQFYAVFPLMAKLYKKLGTKRFLLTALAVNMAWAVLTWILGINEERVWNSFFLQFLFEFACGMAAADRIDEVGVWFRRTSALKLLALGVASYAVLMVCYFCGGVIGCFTDAPSALGFVCCAAALYKLGFSRFNTLMLWLSDASYEWYLVHYLVMILCYFEVWSGIVTPLQDVLYALGIFTLSLLAAILYHQLWDKIIFLFQKCVGKGKELT